MNAIFSRKALFGIVVIIVIGIAGIVAWQYSGQPQKSDTQETALKPMKLPITIGIIKYIPPLDPYVAGLKDGMKEFGYVEGRDVTYLEESSMGNPDLSKLNAIAKKFIAQGADILYPFPIEASLAALQETIAAGRTDIPIIAVGANAPVEQGLVQSYKSSGNNVAAIAIDLSVTTAKKLEFLRQLSPAAKKIGVFIERKPNLTSGLMFQELQKHAPEFGFELVVQTIESPAPGPTAIEEVKTKINAFKPGDIDAWFHIPGGILTLPDASNAINSATKRLKIPSLMVNGFQVQTGGLLSYGFDIYQAGRQSAIITDKIIKGVAPSEIPVEFVKKNELVINLKTAQEIGVTIPQNILSIADKVIPK